MRSDQPCSKLNRLDKKEKEKEMKLNTMELFIVTYYNRSAVLPDFVSKVLSSSLFTEKEEANRIKEELTELAQQKGIKTISFSVEPLENYLQKIEQNQKNYR